MKYRRRVTETEAIQFNKMGDHSAVMQEVTGYFYVITAHGAKAYLNSGDWILPEPNGEGFYPVTNEIFHATYEELK